MSIRAASHRSSIAILLIDVINHFEFPDGPSLLRQALPVAPRIQRLKQRAYRAAIPVVYVNDNFGQWRSDAKALLQYCIRQEARGREFVEVVRPEEQDYFVLKPMHSAFYQSPLEALLRNLGITSLVLAGLTTESCVLCTAHDADMRDFGLIVLSDCCAARTSREHRQAIDHLAAMTKVTVMKSSSLKLSAKRLLKEIPSPGRRIA